MILESSKQAIKNYRSMKKEIDSMDKISDSFMSLIDKNSQEWKKLFLIKNDKLDELKRYKFLFAAILESTKDDLRTDFKDFRFAHDENDRNMKKLLGK